MRRLYCDQEAAVLDASRSGQWNTELRQHVGSCSVCADALLVAEFLQEENRLATSESVSLPSREFLWWKSQLLLKHRAMKQATRPIELLRTFAYLASSITLSWFLMNLVQAGTELSRYSASLQYVFSWSGGYALVGGATSVLCVAVGSLYLLWGEK